MTIFDLLFLASLLFILVSLFVIFIAALRRRAPTLRWWARILGLYLAAYAVALILASLLSPRRIYSPGERRCWDDWCAAAVRVAPARGSGSFPCQLEPATSIWLAEIQVSSVAKAVRQRAPDARAELEDQQGGRYSPCGTPLDQGAAAVSRGVAGLWHELSDPLGPGDSFTVVLPFALPANRQPAGIVMHHGDFPGIVIIGDDSSFLHRRALQRIAVSPHG